MRRIVRLLSSACMLCLPLGACDRKAPTETSPPVATAAPEPTPSPPPSASAAATETAAPASAAAPVPSARPRTAPTATGKSSALAPKPEAPTRKVTTAVGSGASGDGFHLSIQAPTPIKAGETSAAVVVLKAVDPYKCNEKYPYKLVLDPPAGGVSYTQPVVRGMAVAEKQSSMSVPFSATQAGPATIAGLMHFSICTADKCLIEKRRLSVTVQVD